MTAPDPRPDTRTESVYRLAPHASVRIVGSALAAVGGLILIATVLLAVLQAPGAVLVVVVLVGVLAVGAIAAWVARGPVIIRLDAVGYRARVRRGHGVRAARWSDLKDAVTAEVAGVPCVVLRLRDGRTTTIPVELLAADRNDFVTDVRSRLNGLGR